MNGAVVPLLDKPKHQEIEAKLKKMFATFYYGDELSDLEMDIEKQYLGEKLQKATRYTDRKTVGNKTRWTISDLNRYQD